MSGAAMQSRCVWCDGEHHEADLVEYSAGVIACGNCHRWSTPMDRAQYASIRWEKMGGTLLLRCTTCQVKPGDLGQLLAHIGTTHPQ